MPALQVEIFNMNGQFFPQPPLTSVEVEKSPLLKGDLGGLVRHPVGASGKERLPRKELFY